MMILAVFLLALGSIGEVAAVVLEIKEREPVYALFMKLFPWVFGLGAVILALSIAG